MSLKIWLPLNGNTNNQGLSEVEIKGEPSEWTTGRLGSCATFKGNYHVISTETTHEFDYLDNFSWCCWINPDYNGTSIGAAKYIFTVGRVDFSSYGYGMQILSASQCRVWFGNRYYDINIPSNMWSHVAFTYSNKIICVYVNGVLSATTTFNGTLPTYGNSVGLGIGCFRFSGGNIYYSSFSINDFRIYDNCLSSKEIHIISQGLICHYPMSMIDGNIIGRNLLDSSGLIDWNGRNWSNGTINDIIINEVTSEGWHFKTGNTGVFNSNGICINFERKNSGLKTGDVVTFSVDVKGTIGSGSPYIQYWSTTTSSSDFWNRREFGDLMNDVKSDEWTRYSVTVTLRDLYTGKDSDYFCVGGGYNADLYVKNAKVELGSSPTPYMASLKDTPEMYDNTIYDTSGFSHHGSIVPSSAPTIYNESPRYNYSYYFGNKHCINVTNIFSSEVLFPTITVNFYVNQTSDKNGGYATVFSWNGYSGKGIWLGVNTEGHGQWSYIGGNSPNYCFGGYVSKNTWTMFTYIFDNGEAYWYCNGIRNGSKTTYETKTLTLNGGFVIGDIYAGHHWNTNFNGYLSDFRIYATALSDKDILELYNTPVSLTNTGTLMTQGEFIEK